MRSSLPQRARLPAAPGLDGTRRRILEVSLQLFAARGFAATSVRDLATVLELRPSALYAHFASKEDLLAELSRLGHEAQEAALLAALEGANATPAEQVRALAEANAHLHATHPHLAVLVNEELDALPERLAAPSLAIRSRSAALLLDVIQRGLEDGSFETPSAIVTAAAIAAMGVRIPYWFPSTDVVDVATLAAVQGELALRMLGHVAPPSAKKGKRR